MMRERDANREIFTNYSKDKENGGGVDTGEPFQGIWGWLLMSENVTLLQHLLSIAIIRIRKQHVSEVTCSYCIVL